MKFKEALIAAGIQNPGRTTWHGKAIDGTPVITIWADDIHQIDGRFFAWWDHAGEPGLHKDIAARQKAKARAFVRRLAGAVDKHCRVVIVHPSQPKPARRSFASATYPHPNWAVGLIRAADTEALQFIVELVSATETTA